MRTAIVSILTNLELSNEFRRIKYAGMNLEKTGANIKGFQNKEFLYEIGSFNHRVLNSSPCFYSNVDIEVNDRRLISMSEEMFRVRGLVQQVLVSLWLIKDNAVNSNLIISRAEDNYSANNRATMMFSNSHGEYRKVLFTKEELQESLEWLYLLYHETSESTYQHEEHKEKETDSILYLNSDKHLDYTNFNRIQRMMRFVTLARSESFLYAKITFNISALEAILTNSAVEIRMQVADRGARLLGNEYEERIRINRIISIAYSFRSNYIHGSVNSEKGLRKSLKFLSSVEELSSELDDIVRKLVKLFLTDLKEKNTMNDTDFSNWVNELLYK